MTHYRPNAFSDFNGQSSIVENLKIFVAAAKDRSEALDHVLFHGPPGLGKTTLAQLVADAMGSNMVRSSAPVIVDQRILLTLLASLEEGDVLFIDEIHRLPIQVEEVLYSAMEDGKVDMIFGEESERRSVTIELPKFTLVGATTRVGGLSKPLFDRFGISFRLEYYTPEEMLPVIDAMAAGMLIAIEDDAAQVLARHCRGTPRVAQRLMRRMSDFSDDPVNPVITPVVAQHALGRLLIGPLGIDESDHRYLSYLSRMECPVGLSTLSSALSEPQDTIEDVIEPFLLRQGLIQRMSRGRQISDRGLELLGLPPRPVAEAA